MNQAMAPVRILQWYLEAGVDEAVGLDPVDRYVIPPQSSAPAPAPATRPGPGPAVAPRSGPAAPRRPAVARAPLPSLDEAVAQAVGLAAAADSLALLRAAIERFDGCPLKRTATHLVFTDGAPEARVVMIGGAPGSEEDRRGVPFVGPGGRLLDRMLASIGLDRGGVLLANMVFWRPPGNSQPKLQDVTVCRPFVERLLEVVDPDILLTLGDLPTRVLLGRHEGVGRSRGKWLEFSTPRLSRPIRVMPFHHPDTLIATPIYKRDAWRDLLELRRRLDAS